MGGLVVFRIGAVISDFRSGQNNNLSGIGRVSENFLVTSNGSIKNDFAVAFAFGAVTFASKDAPIFEGKDSLHSCSRDWILEILAGNLRTTKLGKLSLSVDFLSVGGLVRSVHFSCHIDSVDSTLKGRPLAECSRSTTVRSAGAFLSY